MTIDPAIKAEAARIRAKSDELNAWFLTHPPQVAAVIATRLAFRTLPFVIADTFEGEFGKKERHQIATAFRYLALASLSARSPSAALYDTCTAINTVAPKSGNTATATIVEASFAAVTLALVKDRARAATDVAARASHAVQLSLFETGKESPWGAVATDMAWIEAGGHSISLLSQRLWLDRHSSDNPPEPSETRWNRLRSILISDDASWKVWATWYEDRMTGTPSQSDEIEYFRLTLVRDAHVKVRDSSQAGQHLWRQDLEANQKLLRNDARKANRLVEKFILETGSEDRTVTEPTIHQTPLVNSSEMHSKRPLLDSMTQWMTRAILLALGLLFAISGVLFRSFWLSGWGRKTFILLALLTVALVRHWGAEGKPRWVRFGLTSATGLALALLALVYINL